jgi:hypothetical protein
MDAWTIAGIGAVVAGVSLVFAIGAILSSRSALAKAAAIAQVNRTQVDRANDAAQAARKEAAAAIRRLSEVERRLVESQTELRGAVQRSQQLDERLSETESRLTETEERLREATDGLAPRIPSGRSVARLNDLRETLRAQAAEAARTAEEAQ